MVFLVVYIFCLVSVLGLGGLAAWSDFRGMKIANPISLLVALLFPVAWGACRFADVAVFSPFTSHLASAAAVLGVTFLLFAARIIGGADSKLLSAFALWTGMKGVAALLLYTAVAGAFLGLAALFLKKWPVCRNARPDGWIARLQGGESVVAYGIAIAAGAVMSFWALGYFSSATLALFLVAKS